MRRRRTAASLIFTLLLGLLAVAVPTLTARPVEAAAGDPFNPSVATIYMTSNPAATTQLYTVTTSSTGTPVVTNIGSPSPVSYESLAYNTGDNYLYGIARSAGTASNGAVVAVGSLLRIGQDGYTRRVGTNTFLNTNVGAFGADGLYYITDGSTLIGQVINVTTGTLVRTIALNQTLVAGGGSFDWAFKDGYFWSLGKTGSGSIARMNPVTGTITRFALSVNPCALTIGQTDAWVYGNGNLGFGCTQNGRIVQISVTNPAAATPTFQLIAVTSGGPSNFSDATASPGAQTDLAVVKTGSQGFTPGGTLTYTLTVTNNGPGASSGYVLNDTVPAPLTSVTASGSGACTVTGNTASCVGGTLAVGASQTFTITALSPSSTLACVTNTATLLPNEADSSGANNSSSVTGCPSTLPLITCSSNPNLFNTGYNSATGGFQANLTTDANWDVAGPFTTALDAVYLALPYTGTSMPPAGATWADANVGNIVPQAGGWTPSPYNNAQWISQQSTASPDQGLFSGDWYYRYNFNLDASVVPSTFALSMDFYADNSVSQVFVNGVAQSPPGIPSSGTNNPYFYPGFAASTGATTTLTNNWQAGLNTIIIQIKSGRPMEGFLAQMRPSRLCASVQVTKTVVGRFQPADQFTVSVANTTPMVLTSATTTGAATSSTSSLAYIRTGTTYTLTDTLAAGADINNYTKSASCTGTTIGTSPPLTGTGPQWTFTPSVVENYTCTITNTAKTATWTLAKSATVGGAVPAGGIVSGGDIITYSILARNTGTANLPGVVLIDDLTAVLDDAAIVPGSAQLVIDGGAPSTVPGPNTFAQQITLTTAAFTLPAGKTATLVYRVTVDADAWSRTLTNAVSGASTYAPPVDCYTGQSPLGSNCITTHTTPAKFLIEKIGESSGSTWVPMSGSSWAIHDDSNGTSGAVNPSYQVVAVPAATGRFEVEGILPGKYWLEETAAPAGFSLLAEPVQFTIAANGAVTLGEGNGNGVVTTSDTDADGIVLISVRDVPALKMPDTGGTGSWLFALGGSALLLVSVLLTPGSRIRRRKNHLFTT